MPEAPPAGPVLSLAGRRALVTGASRGIGAATALLLAELGADVAIGYRKRRADAEEVARRVERLGRRAIAVGADIGTRDGADALVTGAVAAFGGLDLFVANAGIWPPEDVPVTAMSDAQWHRTMAANVDAVFFTCRAAARVLTDGGSMVLVSSTAGQRGEANHADYAASKGAMIAFTKTLAVELAARDVNVNAVAPGWVETEMVGGALERDGARIAASIPLGRVATPRDIAGPIAFLCSPLARHVTGEVFNVNGGSVLCG